MLDPPPGPGRRLPGLLTEWRQEPGGWAGLVVFVTDLGAGPVLVQAWLDAARLVPAGR